MAKNLYDTEFPVIDLKQTGQNLRNLMSVNRLTPGMLAHSLGFETGRAVYKWIQGTSMPTMKHLACCSWLFEVPMQKLVQIQGKAEALRPEDLKPVENLPEKLSSLQTVQDKAEAGLCSDSFRKRMSDSDITLQGLSEYLMLTSSRSISRWLAGSAMPTIDNLVAVCSVLDSEVDDLVSFKMPETDKEVPPVCTHGAAPCTDCTENFGDSDDYNSSAKEV